MCERWRSPERGGGRIAPTAENAKKGSRALMRLTDMSLQAFVSSTGVRGSGRTSVHRSTATSCLPFSAEELALL